MALNPHDFGSAFSGGAAAFAAGVARHRAWKAAYTEAVRAGRERDAMLREIVGLRVALNARTAAGDRQAVDRRKRGILAALKG